MRWSLRLTFLFAATLASIGSSSVRAEVINLVDTVTANDPGWKYLYTQDPVSGRSVNVTADPGFGHAVTGPGGVAIWALPSTELASVPGFLYDAAGTTLTDEIAVVDWQTGDAPFHYGGVTDIPGAAGTQLVQPAGSQRRTQYFAKDFTAPGPFTLTGLEGVIDDYWIIYIDGEEIYRGPPTRTNEAVEITFPGSPGDIPAFEDFASTDVGAELFRVLELPPSVLARAPFSAGLHRLGVEVHSNQTNSSDMGMSIRLKGEIVPEPAAGLTLLIGGLALGALRRRK